MSNVISFGTPTFSSPYFDIATTLDSLNLTTINATNVNWVGLQLPSQNTIAPVRIGLSNIPQKAILTTMSGLQVMSDQLLNLNILRLRYNSAANTFTLCSQAFQRTCTDICNRIVSGSIRELCLRCTANFNYDPPSFDNQSATVLATNGASTNVTKLQSNSNDIVLSNVNNINGKYSINIHNRNPFATAPNIAVMHTFVDENFVENSFKVNGRAVNVDSSDNNITHVINSLAPNAIANVEFLVNPLRK